MLVDVTQPIMDLDEVPIPDTEAKKVEGEPAPPVTLKSICVTALMTNYKDEDKLTGADKLARFNLANKINRAELEFKFGAEDLELVKKLVAKGFSIGVTGRVFNMLTEESKAVAPALPAAEETQTEE